jgi:hypothetical protein
VARRLLSGNFNAISVFIVQHLKSLNCVSYT